MTLLGVAADSLLNKYLPDSGFFANLFRINLRPFICRTVLIIIFYIITPTRFIARAVINIFALLCTLFTKIFIKKSVKANS